MNKDIKLNDVEKILNDVEDYYSTSGEIVGQIISEIFSRIRGL